jgi:hypothetical protein
LASQTYPKSIAMALANGIAYTQDGHFRGALVSTDKHERPVVEWQCEHDHVTEEDAHDCSRTKWFQHHG